jgi:SET domain-containing protein
MNKLVSNVFSNLFQPKKNYKAVQLEVRSSPIDGRGVFAKTNFKRGQLIEEAPVIAMDDTEKNLLRNCSLHSYYFLVNNSATSIVMGLGYSSLYNHAGNANAVYSINLSHFTICIKAFKKISAGEEITINYNGRPDDLSPVYFNGDY